MKFFGIIFVYVDLISIIRNFIDKLQGLKKASVFFFTIGTNVLCFLPNEDRKHKCTRCFKAVYLFGFVEPWILYNRERVISVLTYQ